MAESEVLVTGGADASGREARASGHGALGAGPFLAPRSD